ncbi:hypothetical protein RN001_003735 [Aquatica leii]|uniref:SWIM-type domain-containing protein n=1 Tax=Aquatica leii TaxID=1421715 RepID=A0AAN7Q6L6_9COLE|nr:hypothetical protein RN001_003735 [Aquatica leii]
MNNILTMPIISLCDIIEYINDGKRCLKEGEALLNAGHVIGCGVNNQIKTEIVGLCLQTSNLKGAPHSVKIHLQSATPKGWICTCSCKAGAGGKCKHIIACLLYLYRNYLDELSCTDLEQAWGQQKKKFRIENMQPV